MGKVQTKKPKRLFSNKTIVFIKIGSACLLFFCCCVFFIQNINMFWSDLKSYMFFFPILFFVGIILVCIYISILVGTLENDTMFLADRYDLGYRIVFTITMLTLTIRSFLITPMLSVHIPLVTLSIISGIVTWITPKIKDNDSADF